MHYSQLEQRLIQTAERSFLSAYGRYANTVPTATRIEVSLRYLLGYHQHRRVPITLSGPDPSERDDLTPHVRGVLAKYREDHRSDIVDFVVTSSRDLFVVSTSFGDVFRTYRTQYMRGAPNGNWDIPSHEMVMYSMYMLYDCNSPAVLSASSYVSFVAELATQLVEVEQGVVDSSSQTQTQTPGNDLLLNAQYPVEQGIFATPSESPNKRRRLSCRICGTAKLASTRCRVCGNTPRRA